MHKTQYPNPRSYSNIFYQARTMEIPKPKTKLTKYGMHKVSKKGEKQNYLKPVQCLLISFRTST